MYSHRDPPRIIGNRAVANVVGILVLLLLILICVVGAYAGLEHMQRHEYGDFMSPIWFVASGFGAVMLSVILIGLLVATAADLMNEWRGRTNRQRSVPGSGAESL